ncbi:hypothetical protein NTGBS_1180018 [Candidatus Nitrotoga sp. BS]|nr:hypothetical protein [Candidatus Nitrotoga sp. BS]CAH1190643.1 hypothetical protein NTGBS_1180018 [Candidatus Nitrotoga sp. BS]
MLNVSVIVKPTPAIFLIVVQPEVQFQATSKDYAKLVEILDRLALVS